MKMPISLLAIALACIGGPIAEAKRKPKPRVDNGLVNFFFDDKCSKNQIASGVDVAIDPNCDVGKPCDSLKFYGGIYGARSAWFTHVGKLRAWYILVDPKGKIPDNQAKPNPYQCVSSHDGLPLYVAGG